MNRAARLLELLHTGTFAEHLLHSRPSSGLSLLVSSMFVAKDIPGVLIPMLQGLGIIVAVLASYYWYNAGRLCLPPSV